MPLKEYLSDLQDHLSLLNFRARYRQLMNHLWHTPPAGQEEQQVQQADYPIEIYENREPDFSAREPEPYAQPESNDAEQVIFQTPDITGTPASFPDQHFDEGYDPDIDEVFIQQAMDDITENDPTEDGYGEEELAPDNPESDTLEDIANEQMPDEDMEDQNLEDMLNKPFFLGG